MLRIAFVDHHLNNYHANTFLSLLRASGSEVEVVAAYESNPQGEDWCAKNSVLRVDSVEVAVSQADAVMALAPDNIAMHSNWAELLLAGGKPIFFDKLLASDSAAAADIVVKSRAQSTPVFCSSALRYAAELEGLFGQIVTPCADVFAQGPGDWDNYGVHTLAMALRIMGPEVLRVADVGTNDAKTVALDYGGNRRAIVDVRKAANQSELLAWRFVARSGGSYVGAAIKDTGAFYRNLIREVIAFFATKVSSMPIEEAYSCVAVLEAAKQSCAADGSWVQPRRLQI